MPNKLGIVASALIGLGALLFLLSYFWAGYRDRQTWTEDRAKSWTQASVTLHSLHGGEAHSRGIAKPEAQVALDAAKAKFADIDQQKEIALGRSRWWASFLWGTGLFLMVAGISAYGFAALSGNES